MRRERRAVDDIGLHKNSVLTDANKNYSSLSFQWFKVRLVPTVMPTGTDLTSCRSASERVAALQQINRRLSRAMMP